MVCGEAIRDAPVPGLVSQFHVMTRGIVSLGPFVCVTDVY